MTSSPLALNSRLTGYIFLWLKCQPTHAWFAVSLARSQLSFSPLCFWSLLVFFLQLLLRFLSSSLVLNSMAIISFSGAFFMLLGLGICQAPCIFGVSFLSLWDIFSVSLSHSPVFSHPLVSLMFSFSCSWIFPHSFFLSGFVTVVNNSVSSFILSSAVCY